MWIRAIGKAETSTEGTAKNGTVGMVETSVVGVVGGVAVGIPTSTATPSSSRVSTIRENGHTKWRENAAKVWHKCIYKGEITKRGRKKLSKKKEGKKAHTHVFGLRVNTLLFIRIKNPLLFGGLIVRILKNVLRPFRGQVCIRPICSRTRNGRRGNHQRRTIIHSLR